MSAPVAVVAQERARGSVGSALAILVGTAVLQSGVGIIVKKVAVPTVALVCLRCVIASIALSTIARLCGRPLLTVRHRGKLVACGLLLAAHWMTMFLSFRSGLIAVASIAVFTYPLMATLIEPWFFRERPRPAQIGCAVIGLCGVAVLLAPDPGAPSAAEAIGWGLLSAAFFTARMILSRRVMVDGDGITLMAWQTAVAALACAPFLPWTGIGSPDVADLLLVLLLGLVFTAVTHTAQVATLDRLSIATVGIVVGIHIPAVALVSWWLLGERPTGSIAIGAALVVGAAATESFLQWRRSRRSTGAPA